MSAGAGPDGVPRGNTFDKYGARSPVVRRLMAGFARSLRELLALADPAPAGALDVGCGEGVITAQLARWLAPGTVLGVDLPDPGLAADWEERRRRGPGNLAFAEMTGEKLGFAAGAFELVCALEVLEHVADPNVVLSEMARVSGRWIVVSVPREPLWRALNLARGAYLPALGNTPGHLQHFSAAGIERRLGNHAEIVARRTPLPWTMLLARVR